jgi:hypothetical protein
VLVFVETKVAGRTAGKALASGRGFSSQSNNLVLKKESIPPLFFADGHGD